MATIPTILSSEIKSKYSIVSNAFINVAKSDPKDKIEVEIGDSKVPDTFVPQQKIMRWDNECNVSIRLQTTETGVETVETLDDKIVWKKGTKIEAHFYDIPDGEGAREFEIILKKKPNTNVMKFSVVDKDVDYFYQPELTQKEKDDGASRPENVVGSYAVYAKTPKTNWTGGKEYKCGKIGHIFRPKIIDSAGTEVWGDLHIENGILSVEIPQDFLDKAVYPVRHAAGLKFGYETQGASYNLYSADTAEIRVGTPASNGTVTSVTQYASNAGAGSEAWKAAIFDSTPTILNPESNAGTAIGYGGWYSATFTNGPSVTASTVYYVGRYLGYSVSGNARFYYDGTGTSGDSKYKAGTWPNWPTTWTDATHRFSIYATYTPSGGGSVQPNHLLSLMGCGN